MAAGLPIVTTDVPGCREVVQHDVNGLLVPVRDANKLAEALESLINSQAMRARMGAEGRILAVRDFSSARICAETVQIYQTMCAAREK
jgi:glycosyltransferase involved in cell wall biosynthesis